MMRKQAEPSYPQSEEALRAYHDACEQKQRAMKEYQEVKQLKQRYQR
jgi:hypothetical protein